MALTLTQGGMTFPDASQLLGAGSIVAVRWSYNHTRNIGDAGSSGGHVGPHVTMPPTKDSGSRYLVLGQSHWNDTNQNTAGGGLAIWTNGQGISSYWCYKAGHHAKYDSTGRDKYRQIWCNVIDDGNTTTTIQANQVREYKLYGQSHNGNLNWNCGSGSEWGPGSRLIVIEFDGSITS